MVKGKNILIGGIVLISLFLISLTYFVNKPKTIFMTAVNKAGCNFFKFVTREEETPQTLLEKEGPVLITTDFTIKGAGEEIEKSLPGLFAFINDLTVKMQTGIDQVNQERVIRVRLNHNQDNLADLAYYQIKEKQYLNLRNIYNKYIQLNDVPYQENVRKSDPVATEYLINKIKVLINKNLKDKDFVKAPANIKIGMEIINTKKIELKLSKQHLNDIIKNILSGLKNDKTSITMLTTLINDSILNATNSGMITETDLELGLEEVIKGEQLDLGIDLINASIYVKKGNNTPVCYELLVKEGETNFALSYTLFKNKNKEEIREIKYDVKDGQQVLLKFNKIESGKYNYEIVLTNIEQEKPIIIRGEIEKREQEIIANKEYRSDFSASVNLKQDEQEVGSLNFTVTSTIKGNGQFKIPNLDNNTIMITELESAKIGEIITALWEPIAEKVFPLLFNSELDYNSIIK